MSRPQVDAQHTGRRVRSRYPPETYGTVIGSGLQTTQDTDRHVVVYYVKWDNVPARDLGYTAGTLHFLCIHLPFPTPKPLHL